MRWKTVEVVRITIPTKAFFSKLSKHEDEETQCFVYYYYISTHTLLAARVERLDGTVKTFRGAVKCYPLTLLPTLTSPTPH